MCAIKFVLAVLFFLVINGPALFFPGVTEAGHKCCGKYTCSWMPHCSCPGEGGCPFLRSSTEENNTFQTYAYSTNGTVNIKVIPHSIDVESIVHLTKVENCTHWNIVERILGDAAESLKLQTLRFIESY